MQISSHSEKHLSRKIILKHINGNEETHYLSIASFTKSSNGKITKVEFSKFINETASVIYHDNPLLIQEINHNLFIYTEIYNHKINE